MDGEDDISVVGELGTKTTAVIRRLKWILANDPTARALVFSQWDDVLGLVAHAAAANGVQCLHVKGRASLTRALAVFQGRENQAPRASYAPYFSKPRRSRGRSFQARVLSPPPGCTSSISSLAPHLGASSATSRTAEASTSLLPSVSPPAPRILLLPLGLGGNGLNLTEAQHVLLMEPLLDPGVEAQAVGRVDRIGQTRQTMVHHFVVAETVEENVSLLYKSRAAKHSSFAAPRQRETLRISEVKLLLRDPLTVHEEDFTSPDSTSRKSFI